MTERKIKIAIDGPAASGKSTTARLVARQLNYLYIDSGALYRAVTLKCLRAGVPTTDTRRVAEVAQDTRIELRQNEKFTEIYLDGEDVSSAIRAPRIAQNISPVAANQQVREVLVKKLQEMGRSGGVVMDGRDITTVVFPDAELKIFMKATAEERARRRVNEMSARGENVQYQAVLAEIQQRDQADFSRECGPLSIAPGAVVIDTTALSIAEQVDKIIQLARERIGARAAPASSAGTG